MTDPIDPKLLNDLANSIAEHSYDKHLHEFNNTKEDGSPRTGGKSKSYGNITDVDGNTIKINSKADLAEHIKTTLQSPDTKYFIDKGSDGRMVFFNQAQNTTIVFNPHQLDKGDGYVGSVFREKGNAAGKRFSFEHGKTTERMAGQEPEVRNANDGKWVSSAEDYAKPTGRGADYAQNNPEPREKVQLPDEIIDANKLDVDEIRVRNVKAQLLDKNTVFSMDANGNIADEIKLSDGRTLTTEMSADGKTSNLLLTDAKGETKTLALGEDATSNLAALFQSDEFAKSHPDVAAQIQKNINADFKGGITIDPERPTDPDFKGTFNKESGAADAVVSKQPSAGIDPITKVGDEVLDVGKQAAELKKMNAIQEIAEAFKGVKTLKASMTAAKGLSKTAKATVVGTAAGIALAGGAAVLISKAHGAQRDAAEQLYESGGLTKEAYDEYVELNKQVEMEMQTENVASQGLAVIITTPALEYAAKARFDEFSAKHNLSPTVHNVLGMSLFDGQSLSAEFAEEAIDIIPDKMADMDPEHHQLWRATQDLEDAESAHSRAKMAVAFAPRVSSIKSGITAVTPEQLQRLKDAEEVAQERLNDAKLTHAVEFSRVLNNPEAGDKLLSMMDQDKLMDMVEETALHHHEGQDPLIKNFADAQEAYANTSNGHDRYQVRQALKEARQEIRDNPQVLHGYIKNTFGDDGHVFADAESKIDPAELQQTQNTVEGMPQYMKERTIETIATEINQNGNKADAHPYLRDIADLYRARDARHASSSRREDLNEKIEELKADILKNPEIIAEYTQNNPELKTFVDNYTQNKASFDAYSDVSEDEFSQAFDRIKQNALAKDNGESVENEHSVIQDLSKVYLEREEGWAIEIFDNPDRDRKIKELETQLKQNPEIVSEYMDRKTGDDLISYADPTDSPEYIEVANIMENINAGEALDPIDATRVEEILNNPETELALIDAVRNRYGETANDFINNASGDTPTTPHEVIQSQDNNVVGMRAP